MHKNRFGGGGSESCEHVRNYFLFFDAFPNQNCIVCIGGGIISLNKNDVLRLEIERGNMYLLMNQLALNNVDLLLRLLCPVS